MFEIYLLFNNSFMNLRYKIPCACHGCSIDGCGINSGCGCEPDYKTNTKIGIDDVLIPPTEYSDV